LAITINLALAGQNTAAKCLSISNEGDFKLVLEGSATELPNVLRLIAMAQGKTFAATIEE